MKEIEIHPLYIGRAKKSELVAEVAAMAKAKRYEVPIGVIQSQSVATLRAIVRRRVKITSILIKSPSKKTTNSFKKMWWINY